MALLGEPGIGKSYVIDAYRESVRGGAGEVLDVDFRWDHDLQEKLFATRAFTRWRDGGSPLTLLVDSLDEHPLGAIEVARQLVGELRRGPFDQLRLRVACRTAEWPGALDEQLARLWKTTNDEARQVAFYALAPLRRVDVALAAGQDAAGFFKEVERVGAEPLAIKPITLAFLLDAYRLNRGLPRERVTLYEEGCRRLCEETSLTRADRGQVGALHVEERLAIASRIAAVCILGRRSLVQVGVVRGAVAPDVVQKDELVGGVEPSVLGDVSVTAEAVEEVFEVSGLFAPRGAGYVGWAHQTYAEFLAARFLRERGLTTDQILREVSNPGMGRSVPALRETIAWLASMDKVFFQCLLIVDPAPLLGSDFAMVGPDEREALVGALLDGINRRALDAHVIRYDRQAQARLVHRNLANQLRAYISDLDRYVAARLAAIDLAVGGMVGALQHDLADVVLNASEDYAIRSRAARAVVRIGSRETKRRLMPLVRGLCGPDPDDQLKAYALEALWPEDLRADELFANLTPPKNKSQASYGSFLNGLKKALTPEILTEALRWTMGVPARYRDNISVAFEALLDEILKKGWEHMLNETLRVPFAEAVRQRFVIHDSVFDRRSRSRKDELDLEQDDCRRRLLTSALLALPPWGEHDAFIYVDTRLVLPRDVPWAIEQMRFESSSSQRTRWATILSQFGRQWTFEVADPIIGALANVEELRQAMHFVALHVDIGSPESRWMRRDCRQNRKHAGWFRRMSAPNHKRRSMRASQRLRRSLRDFEGGLLDAAVDLQKWLSFDRKGEVAGVLADWDIVTYPGWINCDESTRARVLGVGREYLLRAVDPGLLSIADGYVDDRADAGYRYICLLERLDPAWLEDHSTIVWKDWAHAVFGYVVNNDGDQNGRLVARVFRAAPERALEMLGQMLESDNKFYGVPIILHRVRECWDDRVERLVLDFARRQDLKPKFLGELLDELIDRKVDEAAEYAMSLLVLPVPADGKHRLRMHAAAHALMAYAPEVAWLAVWPILQSDAGFGRELFLTFSPKVEGRRSKIWRKRFPVADAGEACLWIEGQFPRDEELQRRSDGLHAVSPRELVGELRDALLEELESRGTHEAVAAIERIQRAFPSVDFTSRILRAKEAAAQGTWTPRSPREIIALRRLPTPPLMNFMSANSSLSPAAAAPPSYMPVIASPAAVGAQPVRPLVTFSPPLLAAYGQNKLAVLFGSGLSKARDVKGDFPVWDQLPERLLEHVEQQCGWTTGRIAGKRTSFTSGPLPLEDMLSELDTLKTALRGVRKYQAALSAIFRPRNAAPGDVHRALVELDVGVLATTNYDPLLESVEGPPRRTPYTWRESDKALGDIEEGRKVLFKIHGNADREDTVVMTQAEYAKAAADPSYPRVMSHLLQSHTFLLVGYGINDPLDLDLVFELNVKAFGTASRGHYALMKDARQSDCNRWQRDFNVQVIPYQDHADLPAILRQLWTEKP